MSISIQKKVVGLIGGGFLTLLGVFLPVSQASAASINTPPSTIKNIAKDIAVGVAEQVIYDKLLEPVLRKLGNNFTETTEIENSVFKKLGIQTFLAAGAAVYYVDKDGKLADHDIRSLGVLSSNLKLSDELLSSYKISGTSKENGEYLVKIDRVWAQTIDEFFFEMPKAKVEGITLETGEGELTGEIMYAAGYAIAYLDGEVISFVQGLQQKPIKTGKIVPEQGTPEPLTILGAVAAIGYGAILKQKSSKMNKS
jgi:hypothetical protein